jgi:hypothetical protein
MRPSTTSAPLLAARTAAEKGNIASRLNRPLRGQETDGLPWVTCRLSPPAAIPLRLPGRRDARLFARRFTRHFRLCQHGLRCICRDEAVRTQETLQLQGRSGDHRVQFGFRQDVML